MREWVCAAESDRIEDVGNLVHLITLGTSHEFKDFILAWVEVGHMVEFSWATYTKK